MRPKTGTDNATAPHATAKPNTDERPIAGPAAYATRARAQTTHPAVAAQARRTVGAAEVRALGRAIAGRSVTVGDVGDGDGDGDGVAITVTEPLRPRIR